MKINAKALTDSFRESPWGGKNMNGSRNRTSATERVSLS